MQTFLLSLSIPKMLPVLFQSDDDKRGDDIDCFALARQKKVALLFVTQLTSLG